MCDCTSILGTIPITEIPSYLRNRLSESGLQGDALEDAITELTQDLLEGKHLGTFTADDPHRERTARAIHKHDRPRDLRRRQGNIAQRQLQGGLEDLKKVLYNLVGNYFDQRDNPTKYPDAPASKTKLRLEMARQLKHHYYHAYKLGLHGAGLKHAMDYKTIRLTGEEQDWVESAWQHEARYFTSFFDDLVTDSSRTNVYKRVDAYVETINAIYHAGLIRATPAESIIHWVLHPAEHCPECIMVSRYSPFTKFTLPAQPKSGFSRCLNNCKCTLRIVKARPGEVERVAAHNLAASTLLRRLTKSKNTRAPLRPHAPRRPVPQAPKVPRAAREQ